MNIVARRVIRLGSAGQATSSKYRNKPTIVNGILFDSKKEATRYRQLKLLEDNEEVRNIRLQVPYELRVGGKLICKYKADFEFEELRAGAWVKITEDVKGQKDSAAYRIFRLKAKLMEALFGIIVREA